MVAKIAIGETTEELERPSGSPSGKAGTKTHGDALTKEERSAIAKSGGSPLGLMVARLDSVAKFICAEGGWKVSNLQLQKIVYLAQMFYMGKHDGEPLCDAEFEAWDFGPVEPRLYRKARMFGASPVQDVFFDAREFNADDPRRADLKEVCDVLLRKKAGELVDITHWSEGAWAKNYVPGIKGIKISNVDIIAEYNRRLRK